MQRALFTFQLSRSWSCKMNQAHVTFLLIKLSKKTCSDSWILTRRTCWKLILRHCRDSLKVVMATVAKMCGTKAEKHRNGATIAAFVFQEISSMAWAELSLRYVAASATDQFRRVKLHSQFNVAACFATKIGLQGSGDINNYDKMPPPAKYKVMMYETNLLALKTNIVSVSVHSKSCWVVIVATPRNSDCFDVVQSFVLKSHQAFPLDI